MIKRFIRLIRNLFKSEKLYKAMITDDVPEKIDNKTIYIIYNEGYYWQAVMLCPCKCKKILHMNLMKEYHPFWKIEIDNKNRISLNPSVHRIVGCRSHFFVSNGRIIWA